MFMLQLENNGLRFLQPQYLMNTGKQLNWENEMKSYKKAMYQDIFKISYIFLNF